MITGSLSRRYAKALFALGLETKTLELIGKDLAQLVEVYEQSMEVKTTLGNAIFPLSQRKHVVSSLCQKLTLTKSVERFALLLLERGKISSLFLISKQLQSLIQQQLGQLQVKVTSATTLEPMLEERLKEALHKVSAKTILIEKAEDPSLLGGIKLQLGDIVYDASILAKLENLRETLQHQDITTITQKQG